MNLSEGGIFLKSPFPLEVGVKVVCTFQLPDGLPSVVVDGQVAWTRSGPPEQLPPPGMGVRFEHIDEVDQERLKHHVTWVEQELEAEPYDPKAPIPGSAEVACEEAAAAEEPAACEEPAAAEEPEVAEAACEEPAAAEEPAAPAAAEEPAVAERPAKHQPPRPLMEGAQLELASSTPSLVQPSHQATVEKLSERGFDVSISLSDFSTGQPVCFRLKDGPRDHEIKGSVKELRLERSGKGETLVLSVESPAPRREAFSMCEPPLAKPAEPSPERAGQPLTQPAEPDPEWAKQPLAQPTEPDPEWCEVALSDPAPPSEIPPPPGRTEGLEDATGEPTSAEPPARRGDVSARPPQKKRTKARKKTGHLMDYASVPPHRKRLRPQKPRRRPLTRGAVTVATCLGLALLGGIGAVTLLGDGEATEKRKTTEPGGSSKRARTDGSDPGDPGDPGEAKGVALNPHAMPGQSAGAKSGDDGTAAPPDLPASRTSVEGEKTAPAASRKKAPALRLARGRGRFRLALPASGKPAKLTHYFLASPPGVVVDLHGVDPGLSPGRYRPKNRSIRLVKVVTSGKKTRYIVYFEPPMPKKSIKVEQASGGGTLSWSVTAKGVGRQATATKKAQKNKRLTLAD
jgi:Tfp pilus assembly protein PilZ